MHRKHFAVFLLTLLLMLGLSSIALGQGDELQPEDLALRGGNGDNLPHPLGKQQNNLRQMALQQVLRAGGGQTGVLQLGPGRYVELEREDEDSILTIMAEFGNRAHSSYGGAAGPRHNQIPEPDRSVDNTTIWEPDFSRQYYLDTLFSEAPGAISMRNYYIEQSSGRYAVNGDVSDWGRVRYNTARYGNNACGDIVCSTVWYFVQDSVNDWYQRMLDSGMSKAEINEYLSQFDVWDRYDYNGNGNFDEPDGYIDHFQSVHAGEGEETGGGAFGEDAIWSHRWYAFYNLIGSTGPSFNPFGGLKIGDSDYWIGDYTIEPENGGVGVFSHEFAHDLGLPDLYDTAGGENSTGFWTLMSQGSYGNDGTVDLGRKPTHMGAWEKFQLGWLDYDVAFSGSPQEHLILGPAETTTARAQGAFIVLPDKVVEQDLGDPYAGDYYYYSGAGNDLDNLMYREFDLPAGASLTAQVRYQIELDWDYAYVVVSDDGGATWTSVETNLSTDDNPNGQNFGHGITGSSGGDWVELTADLSGYTGPTLVGFRYWTDGAAVEPGFMIDEIAVSGSPVDGAESDAGWTFDPEGGFHVTTGSTTTAYFNAYVLEYRQYWGFDDALRTGPYNFGFLDNPDLQNWVERFPYQDGLLINYWDGSQTDNNTIEHPGEGLVLPIDAHPATMYRADGVPWRPRVQSYDSTFGVWRTDAITLHRNSQPSVHRSQRPVRIFNDRLQYWNPETPLAGVMNPHTGTQVRIQGLSNSGQFMSIVVR